MLYKQTYFKFYDDYGDSILEMLTPDELMEFMKGMVRWHQSDIPPETDNRTLKMAYQLAGTQMVRDRDKYERTCAQNAENRQRGIAKNKGQDNSQSETVINGKKWQ